MSQKCENLILVLHAHRITLPPGVVILLSLASILLISKLIVRLVVPIRYKHVGTKCACVLLS